MAKWSRFEGLHLETRRKEGSSTLATTRSIVLWVLIEAVDPSFGVTYCPNLQISPLPAKALDNG